MKNIIFKHVSAIVLSLVLVFSLLPTTMFAASGSNPKDTSGHWAATAIQTCRMHGFMESDAQGYFRPNASVTAEEACALLDSILTNTDAAHRHNSGTLTRETLAVLIEDALDGYLLHTDDCDENHYIDADTINPDCLTAVMCMYDMGIMRGVDGGRFNPKGIVTRAQLATVAANIININQPSVNTATTQTFDNPVAEKGYGYFLEISKIPRGSHNEKAISDFLVAFAKEHNLAVIQDEALNVLITKPGSKGRENEPSVVLQGHMDMVCEKNKDVNHDFLKDPIIPIVEGDWVHADGTTLGADNGVGVSLIMAVLASDDLSHPPIEAVITTDEEDAMAGAYAFDVSLLKGKLFINLDWETEYIFCVSSAGASQAEVILPIEYEDAPVGVTAYTLSISGLLGGHSGLDIDKGLANANVLMGKLLNMLNREGILVNGINGGSKRNAIPRESEAVVLFDENDLDKIASKVKQMEAEFKSEYPNDKNLTITLEKGQTQKSVMTGDSLLAVLDCILSMPNGVLAMSPGIPGLVQTSNNLGVIVTEGKTVTFSNFTRSSVISEMTETTNKISELAKTHGADADVTVTTSPWPFKEVSPLRDAMVAVFKDVYGKEPSIEAIHAGLECGIFGAKMPDGDFISIGPDIVGAHSPDEKMSLSSYDRTCGYLVKVLEQLSF